MWISAWEGNQAPVISVLDVSPLCGKAQIIPDTPHSSPGLTKLSSSMSGSSFDLLPLAASAVSSFLSANIVPPNLMYQEKPCLTSCLVNELWD